jgi:hypothetical protein
MAVQGRTLSESKIRRILDLLASTELTIREIGERMSCSSSTVAALNRRHKMRDYGGRRTVWDLNQAMAGPEGRITVDSERSVITNVTQSRKLTTPARSL